MADDLRRLTADRHGEAATVLADAFVDDPGWVAVGPRRRQARWRYIRRTCLGALRAAERWCGPSWCLVREGEVAGVLAGCAPGKWPPPQLGLLRMIAPGPLLAGPVVALNSLRAERVVERHHPEHDHFLVWMLAVGPAHQRGGVGRRLMGEAIAAAEAAAVPTYLWTGNPDNLPYYRSHGFEAFAEETIPGGVPNWFMERQPRTERLPG